ncbi:dUTP diphosphatase [Cytobacillus purgationiresistens]|uniref:Dimeric dUTPase (All-alpha-NTP-PPase superfamily) n=1 Tax=Cytobacillus purgationiresistens TaxID=863449 RepID=A0ABU0AHZ6_9BACI|nr:dUTP diphosphatase [Cytobacillus purgationiresistens]MDQ0270063.1 dimeric dUTPase (all-alpha-NTP-PPase superfamily) [Cytobacillus purgationiresistens]
MNTEKLFIMQRGLDAHIESNHNLGEEDLFDRKVLALLVELGELANETRCFKFWSLKPSAPKETILEEYVDGVHFILSLGIECGYTNESDYSASLKKQESVTEQFIYMFEVINQFKKTRSLEDFRIVFQAYIHLGEYLGFQATETERAYIKKNEVNYKRQQDGY